MKTPSKRTPRTIPAKAAPKPPKPEAKGTANTAMAPGPPSPREAKSKKTSGAKVQKRMSGLDAAAKVLSSTSKPMNCAEIVEAAKSKGLWESKSGKTPTATISAAIIREIKAKGSSSRFKKAGRGIFVGRGG